MRNGTDVNKSTGAVRPTGHFADSRAETCAVLRAVSRAIPRAENSAETHAVVYAERKLRKRSVSRKRRNDKAVSQKSIRAIYLVST